MQSPFLRFCDSLSLHSISPSKTQWKKCPRWQPARGHFLFGRPIVFSPPCAMATPARLPLRPSLASERPPEPAPHPCFSAALAPQTHWHSQPGGARAHYADALRGAARCNCKPAASVRLALAVDGNRHCRHSCQHHASASPSAAILALFYLYPLFFFSFFISACFLFIPSCVSPQTIPITIAAL